MNLRNCVSPKCALPVNDIHWCSPGKQHFLSTTNCYKWLFEIVLKLRKVARFSTNSFYETEKETAHNYMRLKSLYFQTKLSRRVFVAAAKFSRFLSLAYFFRC